MVKKMALKSFEIVSVLSFLNMLLKYFLTSSIALNQVDK